MKLVALEAACTIPSHCETKSCQQKIQLPQKCDPGKRPKLKIKVTRSKVLVPKEMSFHNASIFHVSMS
jgi:hypothetical protein